MPRLAYRGKKLYDQAIADFTKAIKLKPDLAEAYSNRALQYHLTGRGSQGLPDANRAVALLPKNAVVIYIRAAIHRRSWDSETRRSPTTAKPYRSLPI